MLSYSASFLALQAWCVTLSNLPCKQSRGGGDVIIHQRKKFGLAPTGPRCRHARCRRNSNNGNTALATFGSDKKNHDLSLSPGRDAPLLYRHLHHSATTAIAAKRMLLFALSVASQKTAPVPLPNAVPHGGTGFRVQKGLLYLSNT